MALKVRGYPAGNKPWPSKASRIELKLHNMPKIEALVTDNSKKQVAAKAKKLGITVAEYLRTLVLADLKKK